MAWYAYCVTEKQTFPELLRHRKPIPLPQVHGVQGNQVFLYPAGEFAVLVSQSLPGDTHTNGCAKAHFRVVADCFESAPVLPFRFGTVFATDEALRRTLRSNSRSFAANLSYLVGKVEMQIRMTLDDCCRDHWSGPQPVDSAAAGRPYLSKLRQDATRQRERSTLARTIATEMHNAFKPLAEDATCRLENGKMQIVLSHLIERRGLERYGNKFLATRARMQSCEMHLSGPLAPYHFIDNFSGGRQPAASPVPSPAVVAAASAALAHPVASPLSA